MLTQGFHPRWGSGVVNYADVLPDTYDDVLGQKIWRMQQIEPWNSEKRRLQRDLERMSPYFGYIGLEVDARDYLLHRVGQSFQYQVPLTKRGRLARFRGVRVRLVCLRSGVYTRWIRVGPVDPLDIEASSPDCVFAPSR